MRELVAGSRLIGAICYMILVGLIFYLAAWLAILILTIWIVVQVVNWATLLVNPKSRHAARAVASPLLLTSVVGTVVIVIPFMFPRDTPHPPWLVIVSGIILMLGITAYFYRRSDRSSSTEIVAVASTILAGVVFVTSAFGVWLHWPQQVLVANAPEHGTAVTIEDVWAEVPCKPETSQIEPTTDAWISFDRTRIDRFGTCVLDAKYVDEVSYFFQASSPEALSEWLLSGDLHLDGKIASYYEIYRNGAVAIVNTDGHARYAIPHFYEELPLPDD